jgi:hypothetical protein
MPEQRTGDRSTGRGKAFHHAPKPDKRPPVAQEQKSELVARLMPAGLPVTIERLRAIRPGQTIRYYVGNLERDIHLAAGVTPTYHALLDLLHWTVVTLEERRRIVVRREQVVVVPPDEKRRAVVVVFYYATGVQLA